MLTNYTPFINVLIFFIPLTLFGFVLIVKATKKINIELLLPISVLMGISVFIFLLNAVSFFIKGEEGIKLIYYIFSISSLYLFVKNFKKEYLVLNRGLLLPLINIVLWCLFIFWSVGRSVFGGDVMLFYSLGSTFTRGNFPVMSPWQPDLTSGYHYGGSILLGAINVLTNFDFEFIHLVLSFIYIASACVILFSIMGRPKRLLDYLWSNLVVLITFVTVGINFIVFPKVESIVNLNYQGGFKDVIRLLRQLPSVNTAVETYGGWSSNISGFVYFMHHGLGLSMVLLGIALLYLRNDTRKRFTYLVFSVILLSLSLVNESFFIILLPVLLYYLFRDYFLGLVKFCINLYIFSRKKLKLKVKIIRLYSLYQKGCKTAIFLILLAIFSSAILINQGGIITDEMLKKNNLEKSIVIFPKRDYFINGFSDVVAMYSYKIRQVKTHLVNYPNNLYFGNWYLIGLNIIIPIQLLLLVFINIKRNENKHLFNSIFLMGLTSLLSYFFIVPRFFPPNGNRLAGLSYQIFSFNMIMILGEIYRYREKNKIIIYFKKAFLFIVLFVIVVSSISPLLQNSFNYYSKNRMIAYKNKGKDKMASWIKKYIPQNSRLLNLVGNAPFTSYNADILTYSGVYTPLFEPKYRAYTMEIGPEILDLAYTLNPTLIKKVGITHIVIDRYNYELLSDSRKIFFDNNRDTVLVHMEKDGNNYKKLYTVKEDIYQEKDITGTLSELNVIIPTDAKIYIDKWKPNLPWVELRKAVIFELSDRSVLLEWGPGVYLNVEKYLLYKDPPKSINDVEYLVLERQTDPKEVCNCKANLIWKGLRDSVFVYKRIGNTI